MRGDLAKREPVMLKNWYDKQLYQKIRQATKGKKSFICMMALHMRTVTSISVTPLIKF